MLVFRVRYYGPNRSFSGIEKLRDLAYTDIDAALELGVHHSSVSQSLRKGNKTKGLNFKYV